MSSEKVITNWEARFQEFQSACDEKFDKLKKKVKTLKENVKSANERINELEQKLTQYEDYQQQYYEGYNNDYNDYNDNDSQCEDYEDEERIRLYEEVAQIIDKLKRTARSHSVPSSTRMRQDTGYSGWESSSNMRVDENSESENGNPRKTRISEKQVESEDEPPKKKQKKNKSSSLQSQNFHDSHQNNNNNNNINIDQSETTTVQSKSIDDIDIEFAEMSTQPIESSHQDEEEDASMKTKKKKKKKSSLPENSVSSSKKNQPENTQVEGEEDKSTKSDENTSEASSSVYLDAETGEHIDPKIGKKYSLSISSVINQFECEFCDKLYKTKKGLQAHLKVHHKDQSDAVQSNSITSAAAKVKTPRKSPGKSTSTNVTKQSMLKLNGGLLTRTKVKAPIKKTPNVQEASTSGTSNTVPTSTTPKTLPTKTGNNLNKNSTTTSKSSPIKATDNLQGTSKIRKRDDSVECDICQKVMKKSSMSRHLKTVHSVLANSTSITEKISPKTNTNNTETNKTKESGNNKEQKKKNMNASTSNGSVQLQNCSFCSFSCELSSDFDEHKKIHLRDPNFLKKYYDGKIPENLACGECTKEYDKSETLQAHIIEAHSLDFPFPCQHCHRGYHTKEILLKHVQSRHPQADFSDTSEYSSDDSVY